MIQLDLESYNKCYQLLNQVFATLPDNLECATRSWGKSSTREASFAVFKSGMLFLICNKQTFLFRNFPYILRFEETNFIIN